METLARLRAVFDTAALDELTLGDTGLQASLVVGFLREAPVLRANLARACTTGGEAYRLALLQLRGCARQVGGRRLLDLALTLERGESCAATRQRALSSVDEQLRLLQRELRAFRPPA